MSQNNNVIRKFFFSLEKEVITVIIKRIYTIIFKNHITCNFYVCLGNKNKMKKKTRQAKKKEIKSKSFNTKQR